MKGTVEAQQRAWTIRFEDGSKCKYYPKDSELFTPGRAVEVEVQVVDTPKGVTREITKLVDVCIIQTSMEQTIKL